MNKMILLTGLILGTLFLGPPLSPDTQSGDEAVAALAEKFDGTKASDFPDYESVSQCWEGSGVTYQNAEYVNDEVFNLLEPEWLLVDPNTEDIVAISYLVKSTEGAPSEWEGEFRGLWPNQQATYGPDWVRLPVWALTDFPNEAGLFADNNPMVSCSPPADATPAESEPTAVPPEAEIMPAEEVVAGLAELFDGKNISEFPDYIVMGGCFEGSGQTYENATLAEDEVFSPLEPEWFMVDPYDGTIVGVSYLVKSTAGAPSVWLDEFRGLWPSMQAYKGEGWVRLPVWAMTDYPNEDGLMADNNPSIECRLPQEVQVEPTEVAIAEEETAAEEPSSTGLSDQAVVIIAVGLIVIVGGGVVVVLRRRR